MSMGKQRIGITNSLRDNWVAEFEKTIAAGKYVPFLRTQDVSSFGIRARVPCPYDQGRVYHTMSFNETLTLTDLLRDPAIVDIKEQYPVTDIEKSRAFANAMGIRHPRYMWSAVDSIITWDFLCTLIDGTIRVISVKPKSLLTDKRTEEKMELEEVLADSLGYEYKITTDEDIRTEKTRNLLRVKRGAKLTSELESFYPTWFKAFVKAIKKHQHETLSFSIALLAKKLHIQYSQSFTLMQHAFWKQHVISSDLLPLRPESSPYLLEVASNV